MKYTLLLLLLASSCFVHGQIPGCTDPLANNYNSSATNNNGSCTYNAASLTPASRADPISDSLLETSGLEYAGGYLWSFNDGGGTPTLYRIDTLTNTILQRVMLQGATNVDWEDIAFDGTYFYIGDFGNNLNGARTNLKIYKLALSSIPDYQNNFTAIIPLQNYDVINFTYSNQPQPPTASPANNTKFDCEAMIVTNNQIHLFTKNWVDNNSVHYVINNINAGNYTATPIDTLATGFLVTAADKVDGENIITLLGYQTSGFGNHYLYILSDYAGIKFFSGNKRKINLPNALIMGQAEGLCFRSGKYGYLSNEKFFISSINYTVKQKLQAFDIGSFVGNYYAKYIFSGTGNWSTIENWEYQIQPPSNLFPNNQIIINPAPAGDCVLDIPFTVSPGAALIVNTGKNLLIKNQLSIQ